MRLTADGIDSIALPNAPTGRRGYAKDEVDAFLRRIAGTLAGQDDLTAAEVHHVEFSRPLLGRQSYSERAVDDLLDQVEYELLSRSGHTADYQVPAAREQHSPGIRSDQQGVPDASNAR